MRHMLDLFLHMVWPVSCPVCGALGSILCDECRDDLMSNPPPRCLYCDNEPPCPVHTNAPAVHASAIYAGDMRHVILKLKDGNLRALGPILGEGVARLFMADSKNFDALVPVPLHIRSPRKYNQSFEISRGMSRVWNIPVVDAARWAHVIPKRVGLGAAQRRALTPNDFIVSPKIKGRRIAIIDDVCTTGTTIATLAQACENVGAIVVGAYTLARTNPKIS